MNYCASIAALAWLAGSQTLLLAGVWGHYSFDTDFADSSGNGHDGALTDVGTLNNSVIAPGDGDSVFGGGSMFFSADRDYLAIPSQTFGTGTPYTIAFWARKAPGDTGDPALWDMVIGQRDSTTFFLGLNDASGTNGRDGLRWRSNNTAPGIREANWTAPDDTSWHHYAITADSTKNLRFYLDGHPVALNTNVDTGFILDTIGEAYTSGRDFDFHGHIDEVWIFDETLGAAQVQSLYAQNNLNPSSLGLVLHHRYDGDFTDSSGQLNQGTASGTTGFTSVEGDFAAGTEALTLDGDDSSYITLASPIVFGASDAWTACWWAKRGEAGGQKSMVMGQRGTVDDFIWLNDNFDGLRYRSSDGTTHDFTVAQDMALHHYALVADGAGSVTLYRDGQFLETETGDTSFYIDTVGQAYNTSRSFGFQGSLDEVRIYDSALSETQVLAVFNVEDPGNNNPPVTRVRVYLLGGQSNADGRADPSALPTAPVNLQQPQEDVDLFYHVEGGPLALTTLRPGLTETGQFGPDITFGRRLTDIYQHGPETRVAIIKYANGGTSLFNQWKPGGDDTTGGDGPDYVVFQQTVSQGLAALALAYPAADIAVEGMLWHQGETDVQGGMAGVYEAGLTAFIADVRATYGSDLPFVIGRLSVNQTALNPSALAILRTAQQAVAETDPRILWVDTDPMGIKTDNLHLDADGQQDLGVAFAEACALLRWTLDHFTPTVIDLGFAEPGENADLDPLSNREEFLAGTDPNLAESYLVMAGIRYLPPDTVEVIHPGTRDRRYAVDVFREDLDEWEEKLPGAPGEDGPTLRTFTSDQPWQLIRIRASLP